VELGETTANPHHSRLKKSSPAKIRAASPKAVGWKGGGGFPLLSPGPVLLGEGSGATGSSPAFNAAMLAEAVGKLEGFVYAPSDVLYWQHGHSTERDFIYVTTAKLNHDKLSS